MKQSIIIFFLFAIIFFPTNACTSGTKIPPTPTVIHTPLVLASPTPVYGCSNISAEPTPVLGAGSIYPPVSGQDFFLGPADAPVTLVVYCDFQSQGCKGTATVVTELMKIHEDLRFVFRPLPLIGILDKSELAILSALAADEQGQFWKIYDLLFEKYNEWTVLSPAKFNEWIIKKAGVMGMDMSKFTASINAPETMTRMMSMYDAAKQLSIAAVPLVLINSEQFYLLDFKNMNDTIGIIALGKKQFTTCPPFNIDVKKHYTATIQTEKGKVMIELFPDKAPLAVNSFVFLAREGWYNAL